MSMLSDFYKTLYKSKNIEDENIETYLDSVQLDNILTNEQREILEKEPTMEEIRRAIKQIKENKSPGIDGIPIELYKQFWHLLENPYFSMINESIRNNILPFTTRTAVLSIIHKSGDKTNLKNYRPLSLNNTDYKIIAQVYSSRLQSVVRDIVNNDQTGYIKDRNILTSVRKVIDIFEYVEEKNNDGAMIFIDYEKAFDSIEHNFIFKTLEKFNFGKTFIHMIKLFYTDPTYKIKNNGWLSAPHLMQRGIRQGCSLSALLFVLCVEILAQKIRTDDEINGIKIGDVEYKISQYADDATIFISNTKSIDTAFIIFEQFERNAGLKLNLLKTKGIWLGKLKDIGLRIYKGVHFTGNPVKCLGIFIGHKKKKCDEKNWSKVLCALKSAISYWQKRTLTLF